MPASDIRAIDLVMKTVELGSIRRAAAARGISPQAASKSLAALEHRLGVRLLHRTTRSISLTAEGEQFLEDAYPALAALERAIVRVRHARESVGGPLRVVAPRYGFRSSIWPAIDAFCRQHSGMEPHLTLDDRVGDWVNDRADVGFRIGPSPEEGVAARRLCGVQLIVCASPSYLAAHGTPTSIEDLAAHRCSVLRHASTGRVLPWLLKKDGELIRLDMPPAVSTNDADLEVATVLSGHAIGLLASLSVAPLIRSGQLVPLLTAHIADHLSLYIYYGNRVSQPSRVRAFIDFVVAWFGQVTAEPRTAPMTPTQSSTDA